MSRNYLGDLQEQPQLSRPHRAFYAVPPAGMMINHNEKIVPTTSVDSTSVDSQSHSKTITTPTHTHHTSVESTTKIQTTILPSTHRSIHLNSASPVYLSTSSVSSSIPSNHHYRMSPPLVNNGNDNSSFKNIGKTTNGKNSDELPWLAPLLGVLGALGLVGIVILYLIGRKKKKRSNSNNMRVNQFMNNNNNTPEQQQQQQQLSNSYQSWASLSTINTSAANEEKKNEQPQGHVPPPPAYTSVKQKRLTADTLVDEKSVSLMLKNQYAPQLAFSPSLVAGDFQQQRLEEVKNSPLPTISPSNTLIDNAGVINTSSKTEDYHYSFDHRPKKIEIYEPQVNLHSDSNPFIPYSYTNKQNEEQKSKDDIEYKGNNENGNHHVVDISK